AGGSEELYRRLAAGPYDEPRDFDLRIRIERYELHRGYERLLSLERLHDVQKYEHQSQACMTVLRRMRGRSLLADEVGLGKTIEAGIILKEYLLRGLVQRALILVPASLVEQWDQELRRKFDLEFAVLKHGTAWWEEPLLLASMDTAKLLRHRDKVAAASFDLVVVDEAHRLKNQKTLAWKFLDRLAPRYLLLLTATPVQNDLHELSNRIKLTLLTLQKEMGSSTFAAIPTLSKLLAREGPGLERSEMEDLLRQARSIETNAKFEGIAKLLGGSRDKCVIFTQFRATLEFLARSLRQLGIKVAVFHGALSLREKEAAIEQFRDRARVLVSTEAGGEGRNLQFCHYLVNYDLPWNPMRIEQRIGRLHRLGQTQDVKVFNFTARNTVESYVLQIVHEKINLFRTVIGDLDMVLGPYAEAGSFEDEVFRIWAAAKGERDLEREFAKLGTALLVGRKRYEA